MAFYSYRKRYILIYCLTFLLFVPIYYRLFDLQILNREKLIDLAARQHNLVIEIPPKRGYIYDRNNNELAISLKVPSIYIVPRLIYNKEEMGKKLADLLHLDYSYVHERLSRDKSFVWLKRKVNEEDAKKIKTLNDPNVNIIYENKRFYPHRTLLAHVLGFCDIDNKGLEGIELTEDTYLRGRSGYHYTKRDARGRKVVALEDTIIPPVHGHDLILTIDQYIQHIVESELETAFTKWKAKGAIAIVLDCREGKVLAMANFPTYDLNEYSHANEAFRRNRAITDCFEPGSVFKIVTATGALQEGIVSTDETLFCENGEYRVAGGRVLHDVHPYGTLTIPEVIIKSSNIGTVKIAQKLGNEKLYHYIQQFGFGNFTHIDLPGEVRGISNSPEKWSKISITAIPIGQEIAVTALQMVTALSAIANGGRLVTPYVVDKVRDGKGVVIKDKQPFIKRTFINKSVSDIMRDILIQVVQEGTGKRARIEGVAVAGKTGTAQKILEDGRGYSHSNFISSFIGFVPADDPLFSIIVVLDDPRPLYYGGTVAAPVFKNIAEKTLHYLGYTKKDSTV
ncbi:MAG: penicillin-binding protein 2 [Candidatus Omnitrophica bacterium]|nr:penicillin-binding protein 2 [Candidatus Omnitrophota bacterium]